MPNIKYIGKLDLNEDLNKVLNTITLTAPIRFDTQNDGTTKTVLVIDK